MKGSLRERIFFEIKLSQGKAAINLPVDDKTCGFRENFQEKFIVLKIVGEFLSYKIKFQIGANQFVVRRRRSIFLTRPAKSELGQSLRQNKNLRVKAQPNPHQIIGQLPKPVHVQKFIFFVGFAAHKRTRMAKTVRVIKKIIQPLGTRAVFLIKNIFVIVFGVKLF